MVGNTCSSFFTLTVRWHDVVCLFKKMSGLLSATGNKAWCKVLPVRSYCMLSSVFEPLSNSSKSSRKAGKSFLETMINWLYCLWRFISLLLMSVFLVMILNVILGECFFGSAVNKSCFCCVAHFAFSVLLFSLTLCVHTSISFFCYSNIHFSLFNGSLTSLLLTFLWLCFFFLFVLVFLFILSSLCLAVCLEFVFFSNFKIFFWWNLKT